MQRLLCDVVATDPSNLFLNPLPARKMTNYDRVVKRPLSLATIAAYMAACGASSSPAAGAAGIDGILSPTSPAVEGTAANSNATSLPSYTWQTLEDDLVTMLANSIAYNKVGSAYYKVAVGMLKELPFIFAKHGVAYSRLFVSAADKQASSADQQPSAGGFGANTSSKAARKQQQANAIGQHLMATSAPHIVGGRSPQTVELIQQQLEHEALMLHFTALFADDLAGALTSVLLTTPIKAAVVQHPYAYDAPNVLVTDADVAAAAGVNGYGFGFNTTNPNSATEKAFVFANSGLNHLVPKTVEELRQLVIRHSFPNLGTFLRTVSLMLSFAIASTCDEEAVDVLVGFQQRINEQAAVWPAAVVVETSINTPAAESIITDEITSEESLSAAIARTAAALRPLSCEVLIAEALKEPTVKRAVGMATGRVTIDAPNITASSSFTSDGKRISPNYVATTVNQQDELLRAASLALICSLTAADTTASFHAPFLLAEYVSLIHNPCDFYTMKLKAVLGMYTLPFVAQLPDTRPKTAPTAAKSAPATTTSSDDDTAAKAGEEGVSAKEAAPKASQAEDTANTAADQGSQPEIDYAILDAVRAAIRADVDRMVDNCTFYNGPDHQLSMLVTEIRRTFAAEARKCGL